MSRVVIDRAVVEQAMKAMLNFPGDISDEMFDSIRALKAALAQQDEPRNQCGETCERAKLCAVCARGLAEPVQEPEGYFSVNDYGRWEENESGHGTPLYTAPPERRPLTEGEIDHAAAQARDALLDHIYEYGTAAEGVLERIRKLCRAVERAHGIKE